MSIHDAGFDAHARDVHARSLDHVSPRVQAQLAQRRRAALQGTPARHARGLLPWAGVATAGLALALVLQLRPPAGPIAPTPTTTTPVAVGGHGAESELVRTAVAPRASQVAVDTRMAARTDAEAIAPDLSEDPEFYLWLGDVRPADPE